MCLEVKNIIDKICENSIKYVGIDLGHPRKRSTGVCIYDSHKDYFYTFTTYPTCIITMFNILKNVKYVAIDAPLSLPKRGIERELEKVCRRCGIRLIPPLLGSMKRLTICGICIREILEKMNIKVIETHPYSSLKVSKVNVEEIMKNLNSKIKKPLNKHEIDALICCLVAIAYDKNMYVSIDVENDKLILFNEEFVRKCLKRELQ